jgi:hypothetical protein
MATETAKTKSSSVVRIYDDKKPRIEKVRRKLAAAEDRDISEIGLVDEILEKGLTGLEQQLGIPKE